MLSPRRVLLADDDLDVRAGVEELLAPLGLEVVLAESGVEALVIARKRLPDLHLMVLDFHMPGLTGLDVLTSLRGETASLRVPPCIFYSGEANDELRSRALAAGACAFLRKPVQPLELREEVLRALHASRN
jgi:CheY-like chemotaxis protein